MASAEQRAQQVPQPEKESQWLGHVGSVSALPLVELVQEVGSLHAATQPIQDNFTALSYMILKGVFQPKTFYSSVRS